MISNNTTDNTTIIHATIINDIDIYLHIEEKIAIFLHTYIAIIMFISGTIGNILSFVVFSRNALRYTGISFYLRSLALGDLIALWSFTLPKVIHSTTAIHIEHIHNVSCQLKYFLLQTSMLFSVWILSAMTIERFIAVTFPYKTNRTFSHKRAYISVGCFGFVAVCLSIHIFFAYGIINHNGQPVCFYVQTTVTIYAMFVSPWIVITLYCLIPMSIITFCNVGIICRVVKAHSTRQQQMNVQDDSGVQPSMIATLLTISFAFLILAMPAVVYYILEGPSHMIMPYRTKKWAQANLRFAICDLMLHMTNCLNFWLFAMSGSMFRHELYVMLTYCLPRKPSTMQTLMT